MSIVEKKIYQLPKTVVPLHYDVHLKPNVEKSMFEAEVNVRVKIHEPVNEIYLHSHNLVVREAVFKFETLNKCKFFFPLKIFLIFNLFYFSLQA